MQAEANVVQAKVSRHASLALYQRDGGYVQGYDFVNLLGAMWLQVFWLLTADKQPRKCRRCRRVSSGARTNSTAITSARMRTTTGRAQSPGVKPPTAPLVDTSKDGQRRTCDRLNRAIFSLCGFLVNSERDRQGEGPRLLRPGPSLALRYAKR
jgi:hypothetical protein